MDGAAAAVTDVDVDPSTLPSLLAALSYGIASMAMVFINKAVLMQYSNSMTLLTLQQLATTLLIHFGRVMGYTKSRGLSLKTAKKLLPVSVFYNANVAFALASLKGVNIPMYIALKRLTPLAVLVAGYFSGKKRPSVQVSLSVLTIALGVIIAALGDFTFDFFGYTMALTSVFFQTMYLVLVEKSGVEDGLSSIELMFYNGFLSLPFLLFLIIATGEFPHSISLLFAKDPRMGNQVGRGNRQGKLYFLEFLHVPLLACASISLSSLVSFFSSSCTLNINVWPRCLSHVSD